MAGRPQGIAHLEALTTVTDAKVESLIWGAVNGAPHPAVGPLYATRFGDYAQFGGAYLPGDFKLPDLPPDDLVRILRLMVATDSAEFMQAYKIQFGDALAPLIVETRAMADDPRKTAGWSADTRARVSLVLGIANRTTGVELKSADYLKASAGDFQRALGDWTHDHDPLEWAMAQRNLGAVLTDIYNVTQDAAQLHPALTALQDALTVYQSRSDRIDAAMVQSGIGGVYEGIGRYEPGVDNAKKAVEHLREAVKGIDPDKFPNAWGETQIELANELRVMSFWDTGTRDLEDAIAANQEALKVYSKRNSPIHWAEAEGQLAQCLTQHAHATDNADEFHQSISILHQVLDGYPRDRNPVEWAQLQSLLGDAIMALYYLDPKSGLQYPPQAVTAYRASLEELTLEHEPIAWAEAKQGLGKRSQGIGL